MYVIKRNGKLEEVQFDQITERIKKYSKQLNINYIKISQKVCARVRNNITTKELDELTCQIAMSLSLEHYDYIKLASRLFVSNLHKETSCWFSDTIKKLYNNVDVHNNKYPLVSNELYNIVMRHKNELNYMIVHERDYDLDYFGLMTLQRAYLIKYNTIENGKLKTQIGERPQYMFLRVAIGIHGDNLTAIKETYDGLSQKYFIHATPTLFNAGTPRSQMSSCFLLMNNDDSVAGIYKTITDCAKISKFAGGIGVALHNVRSDKSYIRGTNGQSSGILPLLRVLNATARYINQAGKRLGSFAIYLSPWHNDIFDFLEARRNQGSDTERARDLFYGLWISDLFMKRVEQDQKWTLMCPDQCKGLYNVYGNEFEKLYISYEKQGKGRKTIKARKIWNEIINSQIETGQPYMLYKDHVNRKSNQKNIGVIKSSNLCCEIVEYTDSKETAVCNLASIGLPAYVKFKRLECKNITIYGLKNCTGCELSKALLKELDYEFTYTDKYNFSKITRKYKSNFFPLIVIDDKYIGGYKQLLNKLRPTFNHKKLYKYVRIATKNLNKVIDRNFYPLPETKTSNLKHRPIGIGVQGLADVFLKMRYPFDSEDAQQLNKEIFETIYYAALVESNDLAIKQKPYETFKGSPLSKGLFQFDLWNKYGNSDFKTTKRWDWGTLRKNIIKHGVRNSLLIAPMPTASTSQILGNVECFEPYTSNMFTRRTLAGEYVVINKHLIKHMIALGIWNEQMKQKLLFYNGSVQYIKELPQTSRNLYKTSWEIKQKVILDMAIDRAHYICQSQSLNIYCENPTYTKLTKIHFYGWKHGLKTGSYYIRSRPASSFQKFTIDPNLEEKFKKEQIKLINQKTDCISCSG